MQRKNTSLTGAAGLPNPDCIPGGENGVKPGLVFVLRVVQISK